MATSIDEALAQARAELLTKAYVVDAEVDSTVNEDKPCDYTRRRFNVLHQLPQGDYTYSGKELYIHKTLFTYKWMYTGTQLDAITTPFRDLIVSKIPSLKTAAGVDWVELQNMDEVTQSGTVFVVKGTTGNLAETWIIKVWQTSLTTVGWKIISKTTVT
jgi:hypothetical protein